MASEIGNKKQFSQLEEEYPLLTDSDVLSVINYAIKNGFGQIKIAIVLNMKDGEANRRGRNITYLKRIGFIDSTKLSKIEQQGLDETDVTDELDKAVGEKILKYVNDADLRERGKNLVSKYSNIAKNNPQYIVLYTIEVRFGNENCNGNVSTLCEKVLKHHSECGIDKYLPRIAEKVVRGSKMSYGRDHSEVNMNEQVMEAIRRMGDSLGLDVDCEFGEMKSDYDGDDYDMDSEYNAYMTFNELYAIKSLLKFVSTKMFHPSVGRCYRISRTNDDSRRQLKGIFSKLSNKDLTGGWYGNTVNLSEKELDEYANEFSSNEFRYDGAANVARIITSQNDSIEYRMDDFIYKDISELTKYVKDGYHCGNCWSSNGSGFYDAGDWVIGMSYFTLHGKVYPESIDWEETIGTRSSFEEEKELNIKSGCPIFEPSLKYVSNKIVIYIKPKNENVCFIA